MELPNVYQNPIDKDFNNVQEFFKTDRSESISRVDIIKKINSIFSSFNHVYKSRVRITLRDKVIEEDVVGKTDNSLLTLSGKTIKIDDIMDIEKK